MRAIDVHVHPTDERISRAWAGETEDAERFFRGPWTHEDLDATAARYAALDTLAAQPNVDGALVGGASNDVQGFFAIVSRTRAATV